MFKEIHEEMLDGTKNYYTLLTSLPVMPAAFEQHHAPISRLSLEDRLDAVEAETLAAIELLFALLSFDGSSREVAENRAKARHAELLASVDDQYMRKLLVTVIDVRDLLAALRARRRKQNPPLLLGEYGPSIRRNWQKADFGLGRRFSWIQELTRHLGNGDILAAEKKISQITWSRLRRLGQQHHFSLRSLLAYLLQWLIVSHWAERDLERGKKRFSTLLDEAMNGYGGLFG